MYSNSSGAGTLVGIAEGQLLQWFLSRRDEAAFEALVARHGPMVLGVCRRVLDDPHAVEDAFQATFLVLVRKAGSLAARCSATGSTGSPIASRCVLGRMRPAGVVAKVGSGGARKLAARSGLGATPAVLDEELRPAAGEIPRPVVLCYLGGSDPRGGREATPLAPRDGQEPLARRRAAARAAGPPRARPVGRAAWAAWSSLSQSAAMGTASFPERRSRPRCGLRRVVPWPGWSRPRSPP